MSALRIFHQISSPISFACGTDAWQAALRESEVPVFFLYGETITEAVFERGTETVDDIEQGRRL